MIAEESRKDKRDSKRQSKRDSNRKEQLAENKAQNEFGSAAASGQQEELKNIEIANNISEPKDVDICKEQDSR